MRAMLVNGICTRKLISTICNVTMKNMMDQAKRFFAHGTNDSIDRKYVSSLMRKQNNKTVFFKVVESDDDPELLFSIPFNGAVKITGLCVIGENSPSHPNTVKLLVMI